MSAKKTADRNWTRREECRLEELILQGKTAMEAATILGRTFGAVRRKKTLLGLRKPRSFDKWEAVLLPRKGQELAAELGIAWATLRTRRSKLRRVGYDVPDRRRRGQRIPVDAVAAEG